MGNRREILEHIECCINMQDFQQALEYINALKDLEEESVLWNLKGIVQYYRNDLEVALEYVKKGISVNPENYELYDTMGNVYEAQNNVDRACLCFTQALMLCQDPAGQEMIQENIRRVRFADTFSLNPLSVIVCHTGTESRLLECVDSILHTVAENDMKLYVIRGNTEDHQQSRTVGQGLWIEYVSQKQGSTGMADAINQIMEQEDSDLLITNSDSLFFGNAVFNLRLALYQSPGTGIAVANGVMNQEKYPGYSERELACKLNVPNDRAHSGILHIPYSTYLMKRACVNVAGGFDTGFSGGAFGKNDYCLRALKNGFCTILCKDSYVREGGDGVFVQTAEDEGIFRRKWNIDMTYSANERTDLIEFMKCQPQEAIRVLEIGCGCGSTLMGIRNRFPNAQLYGVEIDDAAAAIAACVGEVRTGNIETMTLEFAEGFFDYILMGDVLEHLIHPEKLLARLHKLLNRAGGGGILVSLPNVMHISIIRQLILGYWSYQSSGIMDRTHLRFYTLREIETLLKSADYVPVEIRSRIFPVSQEEEAYLASVMKTFQDAAPEEQFRAYQYIVFARPVD